jgi:hypothetical protein
VRSRAHGTVIVAAKVRAALLAGTAYVNVHTARNQGGEVRGQVVRGTAAPPPPAATTTGTTTTVPGYG